MINTAFSFISSYPSIINSDFAKVSGDNFKQGYVKFVFYLNEFIRHELLLTKHFNLPWHFLVAFM